MNKNQFQQLKQYIGSELLSYILNCDPILGKSDYDQLALSLDQIGILDDLHQKVQQCRIQFIVQGGYGDGVDFHLRQITSNGTSLFNHYRQICGGQLISSRSTDPLVSYLQEICIREYPNLLMKSSGPSFKSHSMSMNLGLSNLNEFISLVKRDVLNQITNKRDGLEYAFEFTTTDGLEFSAQVCTACSTIIARSFYDSCNRMDYSLSSVLEAIESSIEELRRLANGQQATYSSFIGIRGMRFLGFEAIELSGATLRQFRDNTNPGIHTDRTVVFHSGDEVSEYSGHVLEIFHSTDISSNDGAINTSNSREINQFQEDILQKLRFSAVFATFADRGPVPSFYDIGFPLIHPGNCGLSDESPGAYIEIDEVVRERLIEWYGVLCNKDLKKVYTSLKRLQYAIFERKSPEDSIVDAVIAWEGLFSEAFETTFKVTGSMAKLLRSGKPRQEFLSRLKKLYDLRSALVHGGTKKLLKSEDIQDIRSEVIKIGLECIMKVISDDRLLSMDAGERIRSILIFDESCDVPTQ